jgi:hypothetical protein
MAVSMPQPPVIIVALKQPTSRAPPSSTKAAMVRSAIRPFREVRALVHQQAGRTVPLDDRPGDPADLGPDPVEHRSARAAADNCVVALPEGRRGNGAAAPGFRRGGEREALFAAVGMQN